MRAPARADDLEDLPGGGAAGAAGRLRRRAGADERERRVRQRRQPQIDANGKVVCKEGPGVTASTIRFGVSAELSGKAALSGANAKKSLDLAVKDINAAGGILGKQIEVIYEDNQSTNPGAVNALNKTLSQDNVFAVIGPIRSTQVLAMNEAIQSKQIPMLIGGTNSTLTTEGKGLLFRFRPSDALTAQGDGQLRQGDVLAEAGRDPARLGRLRLRRGRRRRGGRQGRRHGGRAEELLHDRRQGLHRPAVDDQELQPRTSSSPTRPTPRTW